MTTFETIDNVVPAGQYSATFESVDPISGPWGNRLQWKFKITGGGHSDAIASGFSGAERASLKSNLCRFLCSLEGDEPRAGISRDPDEYVGRTYTVTVTEGDTGSTKVTAFRPQGEADAKPDAVPF